MVVWIGLSVIFDLLLHLFVQLAVVDVDLLSDFVILLVKFDTEELQVLLELALEVHLLPAL